MKLKEFWRKGGIMKKKFFFLYSILYIIYTWFLWKRIHLNFSETIPLEIKRASLCLHFVSPNSFVYHSENFRKVFIESVYKWWAFCNKVKKSFFASGGKLYHCITITFFCFYMKIIYFWTFLFFLMSISSLPVTILKFHVEMYMAHCTMGK